MGLKELEANMKYENANRRTIIKQWFLIKSELSTLRLDWKWAILVVMISPLCTLFFLYNILGTNDDEILRYTVTGNMVLSLVTGTMLTLGQELGFLKEIRGFDYYSVLPLKKINLIIAYVTRATINTCPSMIIILLIGKYILNVSISIHWSLVLVFLISGYSLSAVGACIGMYSRDSSQASMMTQIIQPLVVYLFPVFLPTSSLPKILQIISYVIPTRYVAQALRSSCNGKFDILSTIVLFFFCTISVILIEKKLDWRA